MHRIRTEIVIDAAPEKVWAVLADFSRYPEWNPLNLSAEGEAKPGAKVKMVFRNLASRNPAAVIHQTVTLDSCEPGRSLSWRGDVPLIFHGRHWFELTAEGDRTRLLHGEDLGGLLPKLWTPAHIAYGFVPAYEALNLALAARVAAVSGGPGRP
jgi:hypothetical protein